MKKFLVLCAVLSMGVLPAMSALAQTTPGHPEADRAAALVKQLGEKKRQSRVGAVKALKLTAPEASLPLLVAAVTDKSEMRRVYAAIALAEFVETNPGEAIAGLDVMIATLRKPFKKNLWDEKVDVAVALGKLGPQAGPAEESLKAAVDKSGEEFLAYVQSTQGRPMALPDWDTANDLPPYPFILTRFNKDGDDALKKIRGQ